MAAKSLGIDEATMKANMLDYTKAEISQLPDGLLNAEWQQYMAFSNQRQRLREEVQRMMRKKSAEQEVKSGDIAEGGMATTKLGTKEVLLAKVAGKIYAIDNACGHSGYPLDKGKLDGYVVTCRWHHTYRGKLELITDHSPNSGLVGIMKLTGSSSEPRGFSSHSWFTCLAGQRSYTDIKPVIISGTNIARTGLLMGVSTGTFSGNLLGTRVTGTLKAVYKNGFGTLTMPVVLTK